MIAERTIDGRHHVPRPKPGSPPAPWGWGFCSPWGRCPPGRRTPPGWRRSSGRSVRCNPSWGRCGARCRRARPRPARRSRRRRRPAARRSRPGPRRSARRTPRRPPRPPRRRARRRRRRPSRFASAFPSGRPDHHLGRWPPAGLPRRPVPVRCRRGGAGQPQSRRGAARQLRGEPAARPALLRLPLRRPAAQPDAGFRRLAGRDGRALRGKPELDAGQAADPDPRLLQALVHAAGLDELERLPVHRATEHRRDRPQHRRRRRPLLGRRPLGAGALLRRRLPDR